MPYNWNPTPPGYRNVPAVKQTVQAQTGIKDPFAPITTSTPILTGSFVNAGNTATGTPIYYGQTPNTSSDIVKPSIPSGTYMPPKTPSYQPTPSLPNVLTSPTPTSTPSMDSLMKSLSGLLAPQQQPALPNLNVSIPNLPAQDISGLYGQYSPSINSAYDLLANQLNASQTSQSKSFNELVNQLQQSYAGAEADVSSGTNTAMTKANELAKQLGVEQALGGPMNQRWVESAARLQNLAGQDKATQLGSIGMLRNAKNSMYDTFRAAAQGSRAGGLAELASAIAQGQSSIDVARSNAQSQLAQSALSGQLDLAKLRQSQSDTDFERRMKIAGFLMQLQDQQATQAAAAQKASLAGIPDVKETISETNPGFWNQVTAIGDPRERQLAMEAYQASAGDPEEAIKYLSTKAREDELSRNNIFSKIGGFLGGMGTPQSAQGPSLADQIQAILPIFYAASPLFGGQTRKVETTSKSPY